MATHQDRTSARSTPKRKVHHRTMSEYGTYNFVDKDPVIDALRALIDHDAKVAGISFNAVLWRIVRDSKIAKGTLDGWFYGTTISPRFCFVQRVAHALGCEFALDKSAARRRKLN